MSSKVPNLSGQSVANVQRVVNQVIAQVNKALAASGGGGTGTVTSVGVSSSSLTIGGTNPVTSSGTITVELPSVIAPDTYNLVTIDAEGRATAGMLVAYLTGNQTITLSGDASGSGATAITVTLATVNADVGQFSALTVNGKGLVTAATNLALTGDVTGTASGAGLATTLKNTGTAGTYTSVTTDAQGRVTAGSNPGFGTGTVTSVATGTGLTGGTITATGTISLASIADKDLLANISGGAAAPVATTLTALIDSAIASTQGDILYRGASAWSALAPGTAGQSLVTGGASANPSWANGGAGVFVGTPAAQDYTIIGYAPRAGTIASCWVQTSAGTLTANVKINGTSVTGLAALSVSSSGASTNATAANTFAIGDRITVTVSSPSSAANFELALVIS